MKIPVTQEVEIEPATILSDGDGDLWVLLPDGTLMQVRGVRNSGRMAAEETLKCYGPWHIWTPEATP